MKIVLVYGFCIATMGVLLAVSDALVTTRFTIPGMIGAIEGHMAEYAEENDGAFPDVDFDRCRMLPDMRGTPLLEAFGARFMAYGIDTLVIGKFNRRPGGEFSNAERLNRALMQSNLIYIRHMVTNEAEGLALLETYRETIRNGETINRDLPAPEGLGTAGSSVFVRHGLPESYWSHGWPMPGMRLGRFVDASDLESMEDRFERMPLLMERRLSSGNGFGYAAGPKGVKRFDIDDNEFPYSKRFFAELIQFEADLPQLLAMGREARGGGAGESH